MLCYEIFSFTQVEVASPSLSKIWKWHLLFYCTIQYHIRLPYTIIHLCDYVLYCNMLSFMKAEVASSSLSQRVTVASPSRYTMLYHTSLHYTIICFSLIYYTVPCSLSWKWRWPTHLSQKGECGILTPLYHTISYKIKFYYNLAFYCIQLFTMLSFMRVEVASPSLSRGRTWHPHLFQEGGLGIPISLWYIIFNNTLLL